MEKIEAKQLYKENKEDLKFSITSPSFQNIYRAENENMVILSVGKVPFNDGVYVENKKKDKDYIYFT